MRRPVAAGIITEADIAHAIADGKDVNDVWVDAVMTTRPAVITTTSIHDAAKIMTTRHLRHLPVAGDAGLLGVVDIIDVCRALIGVGSHRTEDLEQALRPRPGPIGEQRLLPAHRSAKRRRSR